MARLKISSGEIISLLRIVISPVSLSYFYCPAAETTVRARTACHKRALVTSEPPSIVESGRTRLENPEALISRERYAYIVSIMGRTEKDSLGEFEQMVLLAALRLTDQAYAVTIRREIERRTGRSVSRGAVYITLDRLEKKGYLTSYLADSTAERGGRAKRYYQVKPVGEAALKDSWSAMRKMWDGLEPVVRKVSTTPSKREGAL